MWEEPHTVRKRDGERGVVDGSRVDKRQIMGYLLLTVTHTQ